MSLLRIGGLQVGPLFIPKEHVPRDSTDIIAVKDQQIHENHAGMNWNALGIYICWISNGPFYCTFQLHFFKSIFQLLVQATVVADAFDDESHRKESSCTHVITCVYNLCHLVPICSLLPPYSLCAITSCVRLTCMNLTNTPHGRIL